MRPLVNASNLQTQSYQFQVDTLTGRWRWNTVMDVSGPIPVFRIGDIVSPVGILRDSIPIPGDIIIAMSDSIREIMTQFPAEILVGPPVSVEFNVDEGRGYSEELAVALTNVGVFGSLLGATITSSAPYLHVSPPQIGNLASQEVGTFKLSVDSSELTTLNSPYSEVIVLQDPNAVNSPQTLPVVINVRPLASISTSTAVLNFNAVKPLVGSFDTIPSQTFDITNGGPLLSLLSWQAIKLGCSSWLQGFVPVSGDLASGESASVTVSLLPQDNILRGIYTETIRISGYSSNLQHDVIVNLIVT